eukprot:scaffold39837_cov17-Prasinocladus_malaysianus.AAC.1
MGSQLSRVHLDFVVSQPIKPSFHRSQCDELRSDGLPNPSSLILNEDSKSAHKLNHRELIAKGLALSCYVAMYF